MNISLSTKKNESVINNISEKKALGTDGLFVEFYQKCE